MYVAGIDVDIDVEHDGQKTKVTPPSPSGGLQEDMEVAGASMNGGNSSEGRASEGRASEGSKVSGQQRSIKASIHVDLICYCENRTEPHQCAVTRFSPQTSGTSDPDLVCTLRGGRESDEEWTHLSPREVDPSTGELQSLEPGDQDQHQHQSPPSRQQDPPSGQQGPTGLREAALYPHLPQGKTTCLH